MRVTNSLIWMHAVTNSLIWMHVRGQLVNFNACLWPTCLFRYPTAIPISVFQYHMLLDVLSDIDTQWIPREASLLTSPSGVQRLANARDQLLRNALIGCHPPPTHSCFKCYFFTGCRLSYSDPCGYPGSPHFPQPSAHYRPHPLCRYQRPTEISAPEDASKDFRPAKCSWNTGITLHAKTGRHVCPIWNDQAEITVERQALCSQLLNTSIFC